MIALAKCLVTLGLFSLQESAVLMQFELSDSGAAPHVRFVPSEGVPSFADVARGWEFQNEGESSEVDAPVCELEIPSFEF